LSNAYTPAVTRSMVADFTLSAEPFGALGMSPRQQRLNRLWAVYRAQHYDVFKYDWDGRERMDDLEQEVAAGGGYAPMGFTTVGREFPIKLRRPTAPYALITVIVNRFTGLLFGETTHPAIRVPGAPDTEDWLFGVSQATRLWAQLNQARAYGGAMGSVGLGLKFLDGVPAMEVHDPRWSIPTFADQHGPEPVVVRFEKKYQFPQDVFDPARKRWVTRALWYRRVIDAQRDVTYMEEPVDPAGKLPAWKEDPARTFTHGFGFCPVIWVQNQPVQDSVDGDPDCPPPVYDQSHTIDMLEAQAIKGTLANLDPTLHIADSEETENEIKKGSDNAIKTSAQGKVSYVEIEGTGPKSGFERAKDIRAQALEVAQCILDNPEIGDRATATEVVHRFSAMIGKAGVLRAQYGELGVKKWLDMVVRAARAIEGRRFVGPDGRPAKQVVRLPRKQLQDKDGQVALIERRLGPPEADGEIELKWPPYFSPMLSDVSAAVQAVSVAVAERLLDREHAVTFLAEYFKIRDVQALLRALEVQDQKTQDQTDAAIAKQLAPAKALYRDVVPARSAAGPEE